LSPTKINKQKNSVKKIGGVNFRQSREIQGTAKNVTISRQAKHWFVSIQVEVECPEPVHSSVSMIGVDRSVMRLLTLSDGDFTNPIDVSFFKDKIKRLQQRLTNIRHDTLHKLSSALSTK